MLDDTSREPKDDSSHSDQQVSNHQPGSGYPLAMAATDEDLIITNMHGGKRYRRQLMDMGLRPGLRIKAMRSGGRGPVLISVGSTRIGIGRGMAEKIEVVPVG